jgi:hypothetical protein
MQSIRIDDNYFPPEEDSPEVETLAEVGTDTSEPEAKTVEIDQAYKQPVTTEIFEAALNDLGDEDLIEFLLSHDISFLPSCNSKLLLALSDKITACYTGAAKMSSETEFQSLVVKYQKKGENFHKALILILSSFKKSVLNDAFLNNTENLTELILQIDEDALYVLLSKFGKKLLLEMTNTVLANPDISYSKYAILANRVARMLYPQVLDGSINLLRRADLRRLQAIILNYIPSLPDADKIQFILKIQQRDSGIYQFFNYIGVPEHLISREYIQNELAEITDGIAELVCQAETKIKENDFITGLYQTLFTAANIDDDRPQDDISLAELTQYAEENPESFKAIILNLATQMNCFILARKDPDFEVTLTPATVAMLKNNKTLELALFVCLKSFYHHVYSTFLVAGTNLRYAPGFENAFANWNDSDLEQTSIDQNNLSDKGTDPLAERKAALKIVNTVRNGNTFFEMDKLSIAIPYLSGDELMNLMKEIDSDRLDQWLTVHLKKNEIVSSETNFEKIAVHLSNVQFNDLLESWNVDTLKRLTDSENKTFFLIWTKDVIKKKRPDLYAKMMNILVEKLYPAIVDGSWKEKVGNIGSYIDEYVLNHIATFSISQERSALQGALNKDDDDETNQLYHFFSRHAFIFPYKSAAVQRRLNQIDAPSSSNNYRRLHFFSNDDANNSGRRDSQSQSRSMSMRIGNDDL